MSFLDQLSILFALVALAMIGAVTAVLAIEELLDTEVQK